MTVQVLAAGSGRVHLVSDPGTAHLLIDAELYAAWLQADWGLHELTVEGTMVLDDLWENSEAALYLRGCNPATRLAFGLVVAKIRLDFLCLCGNGRCR